MSPMPKVVGLDYSLTSPGFGFSHPIRALHVTPQGTGHPRLEQLRQTVIHLARGHHLAVIEGASYGSESSRYHQLAGGWHISAHALWQARVPYAEVAPSTLKKFATGHGAASKEDMVAAARRNWPRVPIANDDCADALFAAALGSAYLGRPLFRSPYPDAIHVVSWPRVGTKPATPSRKARTKALKKGRTRART